MKCRSCPSPNEYISMPTLGLRPVDQLNKVMLQEEAGREEDGSGVAKGNWREELRIQGNRSNNTHLGAARFRAAEKFAKPASFK